MRRVELTASVNSQQSFFMRRSLSHAAGSRIRTIDVAALLCEASASSTERLAAARALSAAFASDGFALITGHGLCSSVERALRASAQAFFRQPIEYKRRFDLGKGYGFGGYVGAGSENGARARKKAKRTPNAR